MISKIINEIIENREKLIKASISDTQEKSAEYKKIVVRAVDIKNNQLWQIEKYTDKQVFHQNFDTKNLVDFFNKEIIKKYKQVLLSLSDKDVQFFINKDGTIKRNSQRKFECKNRPQPR